MFFPQNLSVPAAHRKSGSAATQEARGADTKRRLWRGGRLGRRGLLGEHNLAAGVGIEELGKGVTGNDACVRIFSQAGRDDLVEGCRDRGLQLRDGVRRSGENTVADALQ